MADIELKTILHNSPEYRAEVALRFSILREPMGLSFSADQLSAEAESHHIGCYVDGKLVGCLSRHPESAKRDEGSQDARSFAPLRGSG